MKVFIQVTGLKVAPEIDGTKALFELGDFRLETEMSEAEYTSILEMYATVLPEILKQVTEALAPQPSDQ